LGGGNNWLDAAPAHVARWGGPNPTGDPQSRYMYLLSDLTDGYTAAMNARRVQRHIVHFKKPGTQDYIMSYDDIALGAPQTIRAYWHYASGTVAYNAAERTVTATTGSARLLSQFRAAGGGNTMALAGGSSSSPMRAYTCPSTDGTNCASAAAAEWIAVHKPSINTGASMPAITQPAAANFRVVQVADAAVPKVAAFAQGGATYAAASFTTTHAGAGQYLIAGLAPGTYTVTVNGGVVFGSPFTVRANDNTLYFEAGSGAYVISRGGARGAVSRTGVAPHSGSTSASFGKAH